MAFYKTATTENTKVDIQALNKPEGWDIYNMTNIKFASVQKEQDLGGFNIKEAVSKHPDHLFVKIFAIKANEVNDNGDFFSTAELKKSYQTFIGVPMFTNHQNDDIEKAKGECVHAWYDDAKDGIFIISRIDKLAYPRLARGIEEGYINGSSMGCFTPDMRVLMNDGTYRPISEMQAGDFVISHTGEIREVINVQRHLDKENEDILKVSVENNPVDIKVTKEHPFLTLKTQDKCWVTGDSIQVPKGYERFQKRQKGGAYQTELYATALVEKESDFEFEWKKAEDLTADDMLCFPVSNRVVPHRHASVNKSRLIGYFLAEGSYVKYKGSKTGVELTFGLEEKTLAQEVSNLLDEEFSNTGKSAKIYERPNKNTITVKFHDKDVAAWFMMNCGEYSYGKELSGSILYWDKEVQAHLLGAYFAGDGCRRRITHWRIGKQYDNLSASTCSEKLAHQLRFVLARLGIYSSLYVKETSNRRTSYHISIGSNESQKLNGYTCDQKVVEGNYRQSWFRHADNFMVMPIKTIETIANDRPVFNLEVAEDNSFIVEGVAVHNCAVDYSCCSICHNHAHTAEDYCLVFDTPVLMDDFTTKSIGEIEVGDTVIDAFGKPTKVIKKFERPIDEKVSVIKSRAIVGELVATKNHPFLVECRGEYRYHPSQYLDDNQLMFTPIGKVEENDSMFEKVGLIGIDDEEKVLVARMLGYFASEGCVIRRDGKLQGVEFSLHVDEDEYAEEIKSISEKLFNKTPYDYKLNQKTLSKSRRVRIWNPQAASICDTLCPGTVRKRTKRFDHTVFSLPKDLKEELLSTFIDGDGHCDSGSKIQIASACLPLASQIYYLSLQADISPAFGSYVNSGGPGNRCKTSTIYRVSYGNSQVQDFEAHSQKVTLAKQKVVTQSKLKNTFTDDGLFAKHRAYSVEEVGFSGKVYNIETESNSYVANNTAVHNCSHITERKNRKLSGNYKCEYHKSNSKPEDDCPLCGCVKGDKKTIVHQGKQAYEHNFGLKFIEDSFVVNPACHDCLVDCILHKPSVQQKVAELSAQVVKMASNVNDEGFVKVNSELMEKEAGVNELEALKNAMTNMEEVTRSMLSQKEHISMAYVSDLVEAMEKVQDLVDELNEMGYSQLPSPEMVSESEGPALTDPAGPEAPPQAPPEPMATSMPGPETGDLGGVGTITKPKFSNELLNSKKDFIKAASKVTRRIEEVRNTVSNLRDKNMSTTTVSGDNGYSVTFDGSYVTEAKGEEVLKVSHLSELSEDIQSLFGQDVEKAAQTVLENRNSKESETMSDQEKTASIGNPSDDAASQGEVITEKQMRDAKDLDLHPRTGDTYEGITESNQQLGLDNEPVNDTTSESPQTRRGTYETITEDQLDVVSEGYIVRWKDMQDVITEKQWNDFSRAVASKLSTDQEEWITEAQLKDLLGSHRFVGTYETITEDQLRNQDYGIKRWASREYAQAVVKVAVGAISDAIAKYNRTPAELSRVASKIQDNDDVREKAAYLTLINALPHKGEDRIAVANNVSYFRKMATKSVETPDSLDAMILAVADNAQHGLKVEDVYESVSHVLRSKEAMKEVDSIVKTKLSEVGEDEPITDKFAALDEAISGLDGRFRIYASIKEVGADPAEKPKFIEACNSFVQAQLDNKEAVVLTIEIDPEGAEGALAIDGVDGPDFLGEGEGPCSDIDLGDEDAAEDVVDDVLGEPKPMMGAGVAGGGGAGGAMPVASNDAETKTAAREERTKEAQMFGGEMGGQGGAAQAPGAGASLPQPPDAGAAPVESLSTTPDELGGEEGLEGDLSPLPPGSICPVCGSEDVDVISGKFECNNCGSKGTIKIDVEVWEWSGTTSEEEGAEEAEGFEGEGFEIPEEGEGPQIPVAASTRLTPEALQKLAEGEIELGSVSPATGKNNTIKLENGLRMCMDTGTKYLVRYAVDAKNPKNAYAEWRWVPKVAGDECPSCSRARTELLKGLEALNVAEADFDKMSIREKTDLIMKVKADKNSGLNKLASKVGAVVDDYKKAFSVAGTFPIESCREKLARRFGENALALSGPCEGKPIYDCVCSSLKNAGVYTDGLAVKLASIWQDKRDGDEECVEHQVRSGYAIREAVSRCGSLKEALASPVHKFADDLAGLMETDEVSDIPVEVGGIDDLDDEVDPFGGDEGVEMIEGEGVAQKVIDLITELEKAEPGVTEEVDRGLDEALGESPEDIAAEDHHPDGIVEDAAEEVIDDVVGEKEGIEDEVIEEDNPVVPEGDEFKEGDDDLMEEEARPAEPGLFGEEQEQEQEFIQAMNMRSDFGQTGKINMDLSDVIAAIEGENKEAQATQIQHENVQDSEEVKPYTGGEDAGTIGHEDPPKANDPEVPRDNATIGQEPSDLNPQDKPQPEIPVGSPSMGHEEEQGYTGGDKRYTGGDDGAGTGQAASEEDLQKEAELAAMNGFGNPKDRMNALANRILEAQNKKLEAPKPVDEDEDIQPVQKNEDLAGIPEGSKRKPRGDGDEEALEGVKGEGNVSMMGHEQESMGDKPDSPEDHPEIPADNQLMGHENENDIDPEKQTRDKGTVIASSDAQESEASTHEAYRVAGKMIQAGLIQSEQLQQKVAELQAYKPAQIKDYEKSLFASQKGFDTASRGIEGKAPVISSEVGDELYKASKPNELSSQLQQLFTLGQRVAAAQADDDAQWKQAYNRQ